MSKNPRVLKRSSLTQMELLKLGRCLPEAELRKLDLFTAVSDAEEEALWRLKAVEHLLNGVNQRLAATVCEEITAINARISGHRIPRAKMVGSHGRSWGRQLPSAGSVIEKRHQYQSYNAQDPKKGGGVRAKTFRFLVVEERGVLIWLDDPVDQVCRSPSLAARRATGNSAEDGWRFFGISP